MDQSMPTIGETRSESGPIDSANETFFQTFAESMIDVIWVLDVNTSRFIYVSPSVQALRGFTAAEVLAAPLDEAVTPEALASLLSRILEDIAEIVAGRRSINDVIIQELEQPRKDGSKVWTETIARYHRNDVTGEFQLWGVTRDITKRRRDEEKLLVLAENATDVVLRLNTDHLVQWSTPSVTGMLGWDPDALVGSSIIELLHPDDLARSWDIVTAAITAGDEAAYVDVRYAKSDDGWRWVSASIRLLRDQNHQLIGMVDALRDIHDEVEAREALERSERRFRVAMTEAPQGIAILDLDHRFEEVNPALCQILGTSPGQLLGQSLLDYLHPDDRIPLSVSIDQLLLGEREHITLESRYIRADHREVWVQNAVALLLDAEGSPESFVSQFQDITEAKSAIAQLAYQATHDRLTGVLNRGEFFRLLEVTLHRAQATGEVVWVFFCDVDELKAVNDHHGHAAGDHLLVSVGQRLDQAIGTTGFVGRVGGDEFVIVIVGLSNAALALALAEGWRDVVGQPLAYGGHVFIPAMSVGVACAPPMETAEVVLRQADIAVYAAKASGRDRVVM